MSIAICPHCDKQYDQDFNCEHEDECQDEIQEDTTSMEEKLGMFPEMMKITETFFKKADEFIAKMKETEKKLKVLRKDI